MIMKELRLISIGLAALVAAPVAAQGSGQQSTPTQTEQTPTESVDSISSLYDELDEFVITAKKDVVKSDGAKLTYDLEQDKTSKGQSVLDALRKVPMVSVDGQDNIRVKGDSNFKIYVNGKEDPMLTANASRVLKAMPAESVSKIEVITEPGARYDAEGTGGILNLVTERKQTKEGYTGSLSLNTGSQTDGASAYARVKYGNVTADANVNFAENLWQKQHSQNNTETTDISSDRMYRQLAQSHTWVKFKYIGAGLNLSWEPTARDLFTVGGNYIGLYANIDNAFQTTEMFSRDGQRQWSYRQDIDGKLNNIGLNGNASYKRSFSDNGHSLIAAYGFNYGNTVMDIFSDTRDMDNFSLEYPAETNRTDNYNREHTATIDYTNPLADGKHTIETGVKGIFRRNTADSRRYGGDARDEMAPITEAWALTRQIQDVYAIYATYAGTFGNWSVRGGVRYERTHMGMDFERGDMSDYRRNLNDVTPNASVTYMMGPASNLRLAYQMRISRPGLEQMNPYKFSIGHTEVRTGNPDLESERYNSLSLTYTNFGRVIGGNIGIEAFQSNNTIEEFNYYVDDIRYSTYGNYGHKRRVALNGFLNWNITSDLSMNLNGSVNFTDIRSGHDNLKNHGWNGNYGASVNYNGPWKMKYSLYGGQSTGDINLQGKWYGWYYYGLGINRSFLKDDALTVAVNASNFLTKNTHYKGVSRTDTHTTWTRGMNRSWGVSLSVSWNFGHLKEQVKKTGADLENNDKSSAGNNSGNRGGGGIGL